MQPAQLQDQISRPFYRQTSLHARRSCLPVCRPGALPWMSPFKTANTACGWDRTVSGCSHPVQRESEACVWWSSETEVSNHMLFSGPPVASSICWWRVSDEKIITLWLLAFPCMISCWYNSITLSNKPFQKQLEPDFSWAANQLLLALIWLSHCWIAFDDRVRRSWWDNHLRYPALIPVLNNTGDVAAQVRKAVTPNQAEAPKHPTVKKRLVCPPSVTTSKQFIYQDVDGRIRSIFALQKPGGLVLCLSFTYAVARGVPPGGDEDSWPALWLLSPGSDPHRQGRRGQR